MSKEELQHIYKYYCERSIDVAWLVDSAGSPFPNGGEICPDVACLVDSIVELNNLLTKAFGVWIRISRIIGSYVNKRDNYLYWIMNTTDNSCIATNANWYVMSDLNLNECIDEMYKKLNCFSFVRGCNTITLPRFRSNKELKMKLELAGFGSSVK